MKNYSFDNKPDMLEDIVKNMLREHKETGKISEFNIFILLSHLEDRIKHNTMKNIESELHPVSFNGVKDVILEFKRILIRRKRIWLYGGAVVAVITFFYYMEDIIERVLPDFDVKVFTIERKVDSNETEDKQ